MLQVARLGPKLLGEAAHLVEGFLCSRLNQNGGFQNREGKSDLYYTVFGLEGLQALQCAVPLDRVRSYLGGFDTGAGLDFVHLCCLIRCLAACGGAPDSASAKMLGLVEQHRTADGGYNQRPGAKRCTAYACLLGWSAYADAGTSPPESMRLAEALESLQTADGGFANEPGLPQGATPATAAGAALLRHLGQCTPVTSARLGRWLLAQAHPQGGFKAFPQAPMPDMLSTAVALHALDALEIPRSHLTEPCLDFIDSLWNAAGGFHGNWTDDVLDCEYTYYGLLALGHLSL